jgi:hypothetical protein
MEKNQAIFEAQSYSKFSCSKLGPFWSWVVRSWVVRSWDIRSWVVRSWVVQSWVIRSWVVRSWVVRSSVVWSSVGESRKPPLSIVCWQLELPCEKCAGNWSCPCMECADNWRSCPCIGYASWKCPWVEARATGTALVWSLRTTGAASEWSVRTTRVAPVWSKRVPGRNVLKQNILGDKTFWAKISLGQNILRQNVQRYKTSLETKHPETKYLFWNVQYTY